MDFVKNLYPLVREKYPTLLEEIESAIFAFIEEVLLSKNLPLTNPINYADPSYKGILKNIVESIVYALKSLNIPLARLQIELIIPFTGFNPQSELQTYVDWIAKVFQPRVQLLIFTEILQHCAGLTSNIKHLSENNIVNKRHLDLMKEITKKYPELILYIENYFKCQDILLKKISIPELDYTTLIKFEDPEKDLQSIYIAYRMMEFLNIQDSFKFTEIQTYLISNITKWIQQNPNLSEKYPMTLFCGVYLSKVGNIAIDTNIVKDQLKKFLVNLVNNYKSPVFEETFLVYYIVRACEIMDLKLTGKLMAGLTRIDETIITEDSLKKLSTTRIGTIYLVYDQLKLLNDISDKLKTLIRNALEKRKRELVYYDFEIDFIATCEAIFGSFICFEKENLLPSYPFAKNIETVLKSIKENMLVFDFGLTGQLSEIYYGFKFLDRINNNPLIFSSKILQNYLFRSTNNSITPLTHEMNKPTSGSLNVQDVFEKNSAVSDDNVWNVPVSTPFDFKKNIEIARPSVPQVTQLKVVIEEPLPPMSFPSSEGMKPSRTLPTYFWDFFGDFPNLHPDILDELKLNISSIIRPREELFGSLEILNQWTTCVKILNMEWGITKEEIWKRTATYRKDNGFGMDGTSVPDPQNTFYGLCVYSEFELLDRLNLYKIQEYLNAEAINLSPNMVLTNDFIFMGLRILERSKVLMQDYSALLTPILNSNIQSPNDLINITVDSLHLVNLIQAISPNFNFSTFHESYLKEVQIAQAEDGSINRLGVNSSKVLLTLRSLGLQGGAEAKFIVKFLQYDIKCFDDNVRVEPMGWIKDPLGYIVELGLTYWVLMALTSIYPQQPPGFKSAVCPECNKFFTRKPKFCNGCGHKL